MAIKKSSLASRNTKNPPYRVLSDIAIADIAFEVFGKDENELFANAMQAIFDTSADVKKIKGNVKKSFSLEASTVEKLLFDALSELLYLKDAEQFIGKKAEVKISQNGKRCAIRATVIGDKINRKKHTLLSDIKAITYHLFTIKKTASGYVAVIVVDI